MLDLRARRPVRPASAFTPPDTSQIPRVFTTDLEKLPGCVGSGEETRVSVRWSDLDVNGHVNNSRYAEWVVEGASALCRDGEVLAGMDIDYVAETFYPDAVVVRSLREPHTGGIMNHGIARSSDGEEAVRARTEWRIR
jgi:acyl-CoA thioesterase FadM